MASRYRRSALLLLGLICCSFASPWGKDADLALPSSLHAPSSSRSFAVFISEQIIRFHQEVLSPVDGPRSHFRPSSSNYMKGAIQKHGFLLGFCMGCDRLMRENSDPWIYKNTEDEGHLFKYNPVP